VVRWVHAGVTFAIWRVCIDMTSITSHVGEQTSVPAETARWMYSRRFLILGWWLLAIPMVAFGLQQLVVGRFTTRLTPGWPSETPPPVALVYVLSLGILAAGLAMVLDRRRGRGIAIVFGASILVAFLAMHLPHLVAAPQDRMVWLRALKGLTLASGAFVVAATARRLNRTPTHGFNLGFISDRTLFTTACTVMGIYMVYCGYLHLSGPTGVAKLVPTWIPGAVGWAWFTGIALVLGGAGFWLPAVRRLAAALSSVMIFLWVILLHIPNAVTSSGFGSNATTATFEALAFSGLALVVAAASERKLASAN
jgi:uncharacterized membrane protein